MLFKNFVCLGLLLFIIPSVGLAQVKKPRQNPRIITYLMGNMKEGDVGYLTGFKIVQIVDEDNMIVRWHDNFLEDSDLLLWLQTPTKGLTDGDDKSRLIKTPFKVTGTQQYTTVSGGSKTILKLVVFEPETEKKITQEKKPNAILIDSKPKEHIILTWRTKNGETYKAELVKSKYDSSNKKMMVLMKLEDGKEKLISLEDFDDETLKQYRKITKTVAPTIQNKQDNEVAQIDDEKPNKLANPKNVIPNRPAVESFGFEKITLSTSLKEFKTLYPTENEFHFDSDSKIGCKHFMLILDNKPFRLDVDFYGDKMYSLAFHYNDSAIDGLGGLEALIKRMVEKYGEPDSSMSILIWKSKIPGRELSFMQWNDDKNGIIYKTAILAMHDKVIENEIHKKKESQDAGF